MANRNYSGSKKKRTKGDIAKYLGKPKFPNPGISGSERLSDEPDY